MRDDKFHDDDRTFYLLLGTLLAMLVMIFVSFHRRQYVAKRICTFAAEMRGEKFDGWILTDFGIECYTRPKRKRGAIRIP